MLRMSVIEPLIGAESPMEVRVAFDCSPVLTERASAASGNRGNSGGWHRTDEVSRGDSRWSDVEMRFNDTEKISVAVRDQRQVLTYSQLGLVDSRSGKPSKQCRRPCEDWLNITLEINAEFADGAYDQIKRAVSENATSLGFKSKVWE